MKSDLDTRQTALTEDGGDLTAPSGGTAKRVTRSLKTIGVAGLVAALVLAFAAVLVLPRLALGAARPAAGCPAPPSTHPSGAYLYLASAPTTGTKNPPLPVQRPVPPARLHLCGIGFHAHSTVKLFIAQWAGAPFVPFGPPVTTDANGSFSAMVAAPYVYCASGKVGAQLRARDAQGASATIALPAASLPPATQPRAPLEPAGPGGPLLPCRVAE